MQSSQTCPTLTVITICRNDREALQKTLNSVRSQLNRNFQYVVVDGASTDGSAQLLEDNADIIDVCISEPDSGIYNAMNKGVAVATGLYCLFLNAGDTFYTPDVVDQVLPQLDGSHDVFYGYVMRQRSNGKMRRRRLAPHITFHLLVQWTSGHIQHQGAFTRTTMLRRFPFDESLRIASDYKFWLQCYVEGAATFKRIDTVVAVFDSTGISNTMQTLSEAERLKALGEFIPPRMVQELSLMPHRTHLLLTRSTNRRILRLLHLFNAGAVKLTSMLNKE